MASTTYFHCRSQLVWPFCYRVMALLLLMALPASGETPSTGDAELFERLDADGDGQISADEASAENERLFTRLLRRSDADGNGSLSRDEFIAGLVPSRPEKSIEEKQPDTFPQAEAVRWLLLSLDTNGNSLLERDEVPQDLRRVFNRMLERLDANKNGRLERYELNRGGRQLAQIAGRFVQQEDIDVAAELKKLERKLGPTAKRFDLQPVPFDRLLVDPQQARQAFAQWDGNRDGQIEPSEVPEPLQRPIQRLTRIADRDRDGKLSEREFLAGMKRIGQQRERQQMRERLRDAMPDRDTTPGESMPAEE